METQFIIIAYCIYIPVALLLTLFVARTLFKNGKIFMIDIFSGKEDIALATNKLFEVGFYLLNIGFALLIVRISESALQNTQQLIEILSIKVGGFSIYLGVMLFLNLYMFFRGKKKAKEARIQREVLGVVK
jgi:hypothetical protein